VGGVKIWKEDGILAQWYTKKKGHKLLFRCRKEQRREKTQPATHQVVRWERHEQNGESGSAFQKGQRPNHRDRQTQVVIEPDEMQQDKGGKERAYCQKTKKTLRPYRQKGS